MLKGPTIHRPNIKFRGEPITYQNQVYPTYVPAEKKDDTPFESQPVYVPDTAYTDGVYVPAVTRTNIPPQYYSGCGKKHYYGAGTFMGIGYGSIIILALAGAVLFVFWKRTQTQRALSYSAGPPPPPDMFEDAQKIANTYLGFFGSGEIYAMNEDDTRWVTVTNSRDGKSGRQSLHSFAGILDDINLYYKHMLYMDELEKKIWRVNRLTRQETRFPDAD